MAVTGSTIRIAMINNRQLMGLLHARLSKTVQNWEFSIWARNLLDKDYTTRGFYFGNDPRKDYVAENYIQFW